MYYKQSHFYGIKLRVRIEIIACLLCLPFPFLTFLSAHAKWSKTLKFKHLTQHAITDERKRRLKYWCSGSRHVANAVQQTREIMCFLQFSYVMHWPFTRGVHKEKKKALFVKSFLIRRMFPCIWNLPCFAGFSQKFLMTSAAITGKRGNYLESESDS